MDNKYIKKPNTCRHYSFREMQIKSTVRYHFIPIRMVIMKTQTEQEIISVGEDVKRPGDP